MRLGFGKRDMTLKVCACGKQIKGSSGFAMHIKTCAKAKASANAVTEVAE